MLPASQHGLLFSVLIALAKRLLGRCHIHFSAPFVVPQYGALELNPHRILDKLEFCLLNTMSSWLVVKKSTAIDRTKLSLSISKIDVTFILLVKSTNLSSDQLGRVCSAVQTVAVASFVLSAFN